MLDRYAALMAAGRQNCINIPGELITVDGDSITLDETRLAAFVEVFREAWLPLLRIAAPHVPWRER